MTPERREFLLKYRTTTPDGHPTFDNERYYNDMATDEMVALRDKTIKDLERHPDFGTQFYSNFVEYLNKKLKERE